MKYRIGFVTNSSSTSYTCQISGETETFWDGSDPRDYGFVRCENEHTILEEYIHDMGVEELYKYIVDNFDLEFIVTENYINDEIKELIHAILNNQELDIFSKEKIVNYFRNEYIEGNIFACECPICRMERIALDDVVKYLQKKTKISDQEVLQHVKTINKRRRRIYNNDYIEYACNSLGVNEADIENEIKENFQNYNDFREYLRGRYV